MIVVGEPEVAGPGWQGGGPGSTDVCASGELPDELFPVFDPASEDAAGEDNVGAEDGTSAIVLEGSEPEGVLPSFVSVAAPWLHPNAKQVANK